MQCEYCDRKFKYRKSFVNHMQVEHGISDAECEVEKDVTPEKTEQVTEIPNAGETLVETVGKRYCRV